MFKRQISCLLALVMILQIVMPFNAFARENKPSHTNFAKVGEVSTKDYPKIDTKLILQRNKEVARSRKHAPAQRGVALKNPTTSTVAILPIAISQNISGEFLRSSLRKVWTMARSNGEKSLEKMEQGTTIRFELNSINY